MPSTGLAELNDKLAALFVLEAVESWTDKPH